MSMRRLSYHSGAELAKWQNGTPPSRVGLPDLVQYLMIPVAGVQA
jgi:hypothetical protein